MLAKDARSVLRPGWNCWTIAHCPALSVLIDAQSYYSAFLSALQNAKHTVIILAWDLDSRIPLEAEGSRRSLGQVIREKVECTPGLEVYILCWNFAMVYAFERELFAEWHREFLHPRIHFVLDEEHPFGACQHQKIVTIDDQVAFTGGLDFTSRRWDTRAHRPFDRRRRDPHGHAYAPFHDVQVMVTGESAWKLGELARMRWHRATGHRLPMAPQPVDLERHLARTWPLRSAPHFRDIRIGISRTQLESGRRPDIHEVERLYIDAIESARHYVYIENQYLTSARIGDAIARRLQEERGPEFLIVVPKDNSGWLEQSTMGVLRGRILRRLSDADSHGRLLVAYPVIHGIRKSQPVSVHSKIMVVDDEFLRVGSANLSNRSMGFDSECDIAYQADSANRPRVARLRNTLLAEHLGVTEPEVQDALLRTRSLLGAVASLRQRSLRRADLIPLADRIPAWVDRIVPDATLLDPSRPLEEDPYYSHFLPANRGKFLRQKLKRARHRVFFGFVLACLLGVTGLGAGIPVWRRKLRARMRLIHLAAFFWIGGLLRAPADLLSLVAILIRGRAFGMIHAAAGLQWIACASYVIGAFEARRIDPELEYDKTLEGRHGGFWAGFLLHSSLVTSHAHIAREAGRLKTPAARFLSGTAIAHGARAMTIGTFVMSLESVATRPSRKNLAVALLTGAAVLWAIRWTSLRLLPQARPSRIKLLMR